MGKGVKWPLEITARGGLAMTEHNLESLLTLAILPGDSTNPFNVRDGIGSPDWVWRAAAPETAAAIRVRTREIFDRFQVQGRARLETVSVGDPSSSGLVEVNVRWTNLETGQSDETILSTAVGDV